jgi:hypothetical protein
MTAAIAAETSSGPSTAYPVGVPRPVSASGSSASAVDLTP